MPYLSNDELASLLEYLSQDPSPPPNILRLRSRLQVSVQHDVQSSDSINDGMLNAQQEITPVQASVFLCFPGTN